MSATKPRLMTELDLRRLDALFQRVRDQVRPPPTLSSLEREVEQAVAVRPEDIPATIVTMNSEVEVVDLSTQERRRLKVVFPALASLEEGSVSVLAPLGTALLGSHEGEQVSWDSPRGRRRAQVARVVFQPEAAGRFDL
jgi:regulator of nucleoside diphosphate kinase